MAPAPNTMTTAIAIILDLCQMNPIGLAPVSVARSISVRRVRRQELVVWSVEIARLIRCDILEMQCSQLILGRLVVATVAYRPWSFLNWLSLLCISDVCQQQRRYNQCRAKDCFARHGSLSFQCTLLRANGGGVLRATTRSPSLSRDRFVAGVSPTRFCDRFWRLR